MKKILFLLAMLPMFVFMACSDDDDEKQATYTLKYDMSGSSSSMVNVSVWLFEYNDNDEVVGTNTVNDIPETYTETFNANPLSVKVKAQYRLSGGSLSSNRWVQQVFYLNKSGNVDINIDGETVVGTKEP